MASTSRSAGNFQLPANFRPVPVRARHDGWTVERQIAFIEKLADTGSISAACRHVGKSRESLRKLRRRTSARDFRDACDAALDVGYAILEESMLERAVKGVARPIFFKGEKVGEWRHFDERLGMFLLRFRRRHRFGVGTDQPVQPALDRPGWREPTTFDPESELAGCLEAGDFDDEPEEEAGLYPDRSEEPEQ